MEPMILQQPTLFIPSTFPCLVGMNYNTWKTSGDYAGIPIAPNNVPIGAPSLPGYQRATATRTVIANVSGRPFSPETYTVELWFRAAGQQTFMYWALSGGDALIQFEISGAAGDNERIATCFTGSLYKTIDIPDSLVLDGNWHHLAIVLEAVDTQYRIRFYLDGTHRYISRATGSSQYTDPEIVRAIPATGLYINEISCPFYGNGMVAEIVIWRGIPGYIGTTRPTRGPLGYGL